MNFSIPPSGLVQYPGYLAGAPGFEPGNAGIKTLCLTTWLRPILNPRASARYCIT